MYIRTYFFFGCIVLLLNNIQYVVNLPLDNRELFVETCGITSNQDESKSNCSNEIVYVDPCDHKQYTGVGVSILLNGDRYEGSFLNGFKHGNGTYIFKDGRKYVGEWAHDYIHGKGIYTWPNNDRFEGNFDFCKPVGTGTYIYADGRKYICSYNRNDKFSGKCIVIWLNGDRFKGIFEDGHRNGMGIYYFADGSKYFAEWVNDIPTIDAAFISANGTQYEKGFVEKKLLDMKKE